MRERAAVTTMYLGMILILLGSIVYLITADTYNALVGNMIAWACSSAGAIFFAGKGAIKRLNQLVNELEEGDGPRERDDVADDLQEILGYLDDR